jgi:hypothetical protein
MSIDFIHRIKHTISLILFIMMAVFFTVLSILLLSGSIVHSSNLFSFTSIWYVGTVVVSLLSIAILYQLPKFDNAFLGEYKFLSYVSELKGKWYFNVMILLGIIYGLLKGFTVWSTILMNEDDVYSYFLLSWIYVALTYFIPTLIMMIQNLLKYRLKVGGPRAILFGILGLGYFLIGWLFASVFVLLFFMKFVKSIFNTTVKKRYLDEEVDTWKALW